MARLQHNLWVAQAELTNPEKVADRDRPVAVSTREGSGVSLCLALERARYCAQSAGQAENVQTTAIIDEAGPLTTLLGLIRLAGVSQPARP
jgi:hypothetical protein